MTSGQYSFGRRSYRGRIYRMQGKCIPTKTIVSSVEAVLSRQRVLSEPAKDNIRSRIASTLIYNQPPYPITINLTNDERQALKRLKTNKDTVILPADKGRVTVFMDRTDYHDARGGGGGGGGGNQQSFIRGGFAPSSKPIPFYIPFLTEKVPLSFTFHRKLYPFHIPTE